MKRRQFLKTTSGILATLPFVDLTSLTLPASTVKQIAMLPKTIPYWNVFVSPNSWPQSLAATKEQVVALIKEFVPAEGNASPEWVAYWFRTKIGAERFKLMLKERNINSWKPERRIAMDQFTQEQWEYWRNTILNCSPEAYYLRNLEVMDEEEVRITEDAESLGKEGFCDQFRDRSIGEEMWLVVSKDNFSNYISSDEGAYFIKRLEPWAEGGVLREVSFGTWENFLYLDDSYEAWKDDRDYSVGPTPAHVRKNWR